MAKIISDRVGRLVELIAHRFDAEFGGFFPVGENFALGNFHRIVPVFGRTPNQVFNEDRTKPAGSGDVSPPDHNLLNDSRFNSFPILTQEEDFIAYIAL
jgi:hypothetical protein